ncbi:C45 family peptidase [Flammeovirgaceae bacterium SG7u.111]|nr:C45 family peptidase [Flammeovirgaceae bacterium SG7u.132]WPO36173.1 C45 family peptidase [Flammeovirgaceae bacterium SG7u.111]
MKKRHKLLLIFVISLVLLTVVYFYEVNTPAPNVDLSLKETVTLSFKSDTLNRYKQNWLKKNESGLWEMYLEGEPFERGLAFGALTQQLHQQKEAAFVAEINNRVPSPNYISFLKYFVGWFNRDLEKYIPEEYLKEIYGSAQFMSDEFDYIAPKFHRSLNYHAAHDLGHALQNMNLVGCTSFATVGKNSKNEPQIIVGRNFDFYFGDDFAKDKIVAFVAPQEGYKFMSVTWADFSGVVSGMNEHGLTVTLNSAKTRILAKAKTPVSIIARHILQYASTIDEAYEIASSYESFVAETYLISSAKDNKVAVIEKSPDATAIYVSPNQQTVVTNHFQSKELKNNEQNLEYLEEGVSQYRYKRVEELLAKVDTLTPEKAAGILRDKDGLGGKDIGLGNEKAVNQLIAHHAVIFSPHERKAWVSAPPYQLGKMICYDLDSIFAQARETNLPHELHNDSLSIQPDAFLGTKAYEEYRFFAQTTERIRTILHAGVPDEISESEAEHYVASNPNSYLPYLYLGDYYLEKEQFAKAKDLLEKGLTKEIARNAEKAHMEEGVLECTKQLEK